MRRKKNHSFYRLLMPTCTFILIVFLVVGGCESSGGTNSEINLQWVVTPNPPQVGMAKLDITLRDSTKQLIKGAEVKLEGNMSHPGMQPVLATAEEIAPGKYSADMKFTMGGDWFILVNTTLPGGSKATNKIAIPGVRSEP